ncbi:hypothetical protein [Amycolatopsis sp. CA-230715]|uniref:hypothetical protein n=1 Tax=Amycolatopsis sp. CA-230715 TaxID=2745196 RepID=UPI001C338971|nr:hypothetical protein [Amycolatopsis sp. CA-230715]QWF82841.1 hypothetical protein HUW46_06280 [Amycolatopsis sp. CA-230715]
MSTQTEVEVEPVDTAIADEPRSWWARLPKLPALLVAVALVLAGAGGWVLVEAHAAKTVEGSDNTAQLDAATTAEVSAAATNSLNKIFSYSYDKTGVTEQAAKEVLRGKALDAYNQLFARVRELAPQQKLVLTSRVVESAVSSLTGDRARVLAFLDQSATRADKGSAEAAASQLSVTLERAGSSWVITDLVPR